MTEANLLARIQRLEDIEAIRHLRLRYHHCINRRDYEQLPLLFTEDGFCDFAYLGRGEGRQGVRELLTTRVEETSFVKQFIHNHMIEVAGDTGTGQADLEARYASKGTAYEMVGQYRDTYRRTPEGWLFSGMAFEFWLSIPAGVGWGGEKRHWLDVGAKPAAGN